MEIDDVMVLWEEKPFKGGEKKNKNKKAEDRIKYTHREKIKQKDKICLRIHQIVQ